MASLTAFLITGVFLVVYRRYKYESLSVFVFPIVFVLSLVASLGGPLEPWMRDSVGRGWLALHVGLFLLGYAALFLTCIAGVMYLIQEHELKSKKAARLLLPLASSQQVGRGGLPDAWNRLCLRDVGGDFRQRLRLG